MFPTPPSLEHPSPADGTMEVDHGTLKMEPFSPAPDLTDWWTGGRILTTPYPHRSLHPSKGSTVMGYPPFIPQLSLGTNLKECNLEDPGNLRMPEQQALIQVGIVEINL